MICAPTDSEAQAQAQDMKWFWSQWSEQFDQGLPLMLVGSPDTISRQIELALSRIPIRECFLLIPQGIHDRGQILKSLELFATVVAPRFSNH